MPSFNSLMLSVLSAIRLVLILAVVYGTLTFAEFIHNRWKSGML
jgi:hypothetical protein